MQIRTELGEIEIEVDTVRAPITASNFLRYVDGGFYDGGRFFRTVHLDNQPNDSIRIEVIQAGIDPAKSEDGFPAIPLERTSVTGILHRDGTVSMARSEPDTATSSFFICVGDQPSLDFGGRRTRRVLPPSSVGEMTLRLYGALSYSQNSACDLRRALNGA